MNAFYLEKSQWTSSKDVSHKNDISQSITLSQNNATYQNIALNDTSNSQKEFNTLTLTNSEFHHLSKVLRLKCQDKVFVLDGEGKKPVALFLKFLKNTQRLSYNQ